jgi:hypothetical protein
MRTVMLAAILLLTAGTAAGAELSDAQVLAILSSEQPRDAAIRRGLAWLRTQQREDGALVEGQNAAALTALAAMAHLAAGHALHDPEHGPWLRRAVGRVLALQARNGYFGEMDGSRMYGHGICTLMVAEALGMSGDGGLEESLRDALERAVTVTVNAADPQKVRKDPGHEGGWRYQPGENRSDLSLSGWQVMGLHASQQVGITVPEAVVARACAYARSLTDDEGRVGYDRRGQDKPALRGLGLICLMLSAERDEVMIDRVAARITRYPLEWKGPWFFYRAYYDSIGLSRARPELWAAYRQVVERELVGHQHEEGYWLSPPDDNEGQHGRVYTTSMAILALTVERYMLPAYQR